MNAPRYLGIVVAGISAVQENPVDVLRDEISDDDDHHDTQHDTSGCQATSYPALGTWVLNTVGVVVSVRQQRQHDGTKTTTLKENLQKYGIILDHNCIQLQYLLNLKLLKSQKWKSMWFKRP